MTAKKKTTPAPLDLPLASTADGELDGSAAVDLAHDQLKDIFQNRGRGSVSAVEDELGYSRDTISQWRRRGYLPFGQLVDMLRKLRYSPISFFAELFRSEPPITDEDQTSDDRLRLAMACAEADELRHTDPIKALQVLNEVHHLSELAPALYAGAAGSAFRVLQMIKEAESLLMTSWMKAQDPYTKANTLRRRAPLELYGHYNAERALQCATHAIKLFQSIGAISEARVTTINTALVYYELSQNEEASNLARTLIQWPDCPAVRKAAAHQILGFIHFAEGRTNPAHAHLKAILSLVEDPLSRGQAYWSLARISPSSHSGKYFDAALELFGDSYAFQAVLCTLEKIHDLKLRAEAELPKLLSLELPSLVLTFVQDLLAATQLGRDTEIRDIAAKLSRAWMTQRQRQARLAAFDLLSHLEIS